MGKDVSNVVTMMLTANTQPLKNKATALVVKLHLPTRQTDGTHTRPINADVNSPLKKLSRSKTQHFVLDLRNSRAIKSNWIVLWFFVSSFLESNTLLSNNFFHSLSFWEI